MEDAEIIRLFNARDEAAIAALRSKYGERSLRMARDITGSDEDAEECLSDALFALWRAIPPTRPLHLGAYLASAVRNKALMRLRASKTLRRGGEGYAAAFDELEEILSSPSSPQRELEARELAAEIDRFLGSLTHESRVIFMRRYYMMSPVADIARSLDLTQSKVKSSLHRSRLKLKEHLEKEGLL